MGMMGLMDDDAKMLCKVLEISAAQALALKKKIAMGHKLPSWAEYKVYKAGDALKSAMASTFSMRDHMPKISISIKSGPSMGEALLGKQKMAWAKVASKEKQAKGFAKMQRIQKAVNKKSARLLENRDAGIPTDKKDWAQRAELYKILNRLNTKTFHSRKLRGYSKNFPGKHVYKKGKPYARVPKDEKVKKAWAKIARGPDRTPILPPGAVGDNLGRTRASAAIIPVPKALRKAAPVTKTPSTSPYHAGTKLTKRHHNPDGTMKGGWTNYRKNPFANAFLPTGSRILKKTGPDVSSNNARAMQKLRK